jgi:hypothetical protein
MEDQIRDLNEADLHRTIRSIYREAVRRGGDSATAFNQAVERAARDLPLAQPELRRKVARYLSIEPMH